MGTRTAAFIAASSLFAVAGCGTEVVPAGALEASIRSNARVPLRSVSCPSGVEARTGKTLRCSLTASDGSHGTLTVHITSASGTGIRWRYGQRDFQQPASGASARITSTDGSFETVVPRGYVDVVLKYNGAPLSIINQPGFVFALAGPVMHDQQLRISVFREPLAAVVGRHDIDSVTRAEVGALKRSGIPVYGFSALRSLTLGGDPARAVVYFSRPAPANRLVEDGVAAVVHRGWIYSLTFAAPPSDYADQIGAVNSVIDGWRWL